MKTNGQKWFEFHATKLVTECEADGVELTPPDDAEIAWQTRDKRKVPIQKMDDRHLVNAALYLQRGIQLRPWCAKQSQRHYHLLLWEMKKRLGMIGPVLAEDQPTGDQLTQPTLKRKFQLD